MAEIKKMTKKVKQAIKRQQGRPRDPALDYYEKLKVDECYPILKKSESDTDEAAYKRECVRASHRGKALGRKFMANKKLMVVYRVE